MIERPHCQSFHRVHQTGAVNEICLSTAICFIKSPQKLRRHREVCIEDGQQFAVSVGETETDSVALSFARLTECPDIEFPRIRRHDALDLLPGAVVRMTFDEDDFGFTA